MIMRTYPDAATFLDHTQPFLEAQEIVNDSLLGMVLRMRGKPEPVAGQAYLAAIRADNGDISLAAAMKQQQNMVLAGVDDLPQSVLDELCADLSANGWTVAGVLAVDDLATRFAETWQRLTGHAYQMKMHMRAYGMRRVIPPARTPSGRLRQATPLDLDLLARWRTEFEMESLHEQPPQNLRELVAREIAAGTVYLWEDGEPVSIAACIRPTPRGIWIGGVYTPPAVRGRGYASACVAELSQRLLAAGKAYVALYTDLDYPTSNAIYQKIGYRPVRDFLVYHFE